MQWGQESMATKENSSVFWHQTLINVRSFIFSLLYFPFINISQEVSLNGKQTYRVIVSRLSFFTNFQNA